jgi:two-component system chemotaxis response regulator CheY
MGKKVLVVDDSSFTRKRIIKALATGGHTIVGEAKNGIEAVESYKQEKPDLVTMDITMRDKDGITAAREILSFDPEANIIFVSILEDERSKKDIEQLGAVGYVSKKNYLDLLRLIDKIHP